MTISSVSATNVLLTQLEANGLSADKAKRVEGDLAAATAATSLAPATSASTSAASIRAALDSRIAADVSSGKLSESDAAAVNKTLNAIDAQSSGSGITSQGTSAAAASPQASAAAGSGGSGGGGGGGSSAKTELSETVTVSGSTKTTIITYTDDSTETVTTTATSGDEAKYGKPSSASGNSDSAGTAAADYLSTIHRGSLIDQTA